LATHKDSKFAAREITHTTPAGQRNQAKSGAMAVNQEYFALACPIGWRSINFYQTGQALSPGGAKDKWLVAGIMCAPRYFSPAPPPG